MAEQSCWKQTVWRHAGAGVAVCAAVVARGLFDPILGDGTPYGFLLPAVAIAARYCGLAPTVLSLAAGFVACQYLFAPPRGHLLPTGTTHQVVALLALANLAVILYVVSALRKQKMLADRDAADLRRAEAELRDQESLFKSVVNNSPTVIFIKDPSGRYSLMNDCYTRLVSHNHRSLLGSTDDEFFPADIARRLTAADARVWRDQSPLSVEESVPHADGQHTYVTVKFPIKDEAGRMIALGGIATDITELKRAHAALEQKERVLRRLIEVQEAERQAIGHDIHDGLLQYAIGARMLLEGLQRERPEALPADTIDTVIGYLAKGIDDARQVVRGVRPTVLDDLGLAAAIEDLRDQFRAFGIDVAWTATSCLDTLPPQLQTTIYRIVQESLTNVRKHGGAKHARVDAFRDGEDLVVSVADEGIGFDPRAIPEGGFGLIGVRERARLAGGTCAVETAPGRGTRVTVRLPLPKPIALPAPQPAAAGSG